MKKIDYHGLELLPIKSDIVFKVLFGKPENLDILAKFLEALLDIEINRPEDIKLTNTELSGDYDGDKISRFRYADIKSKVELSDLCEINFLELKKVPQKCYNDKEMWSKL